MEGILFWEDRLLNGRYFFGKIGCLKVILGR